MAFENVDPASLKSAINSCLQTLNIEANNNVINDISNINAWQSGAGNHLKYSFNTLIEPKYRDLKDSLNSCNAIADIIQKYKNLEEENQVLELQYYELSKRLYYNQTYTQQLPPKPSLNGRVSLGENRVRTYTQTVKNCNVEAQMQEISRKINANKQEMENLESKVLGMI